MSIGYWFLLALIACECACTAAVLPAFCALHVLPLVLPLLKSVFEQHHLESNVAAEPSGLVCKICIS